MKTNMRLVSDAFMEVGDYWAMKDAGNEDKNFHGYISIAKRAYDQAVAASARAVNEETYAFRGRQIH